MSKPCAPNRAEAPESEESNCESATASQSVAADATSSVRPMIGDTVLVISGDGIISNFLGRTDTSLVTSASELCGSPIERLWPTEMATLVRKIVKRTLRDRQVHSEEYEHSDDGGHYQVIVVAQGQNRALVVVRDISKQKAVISEIRQHAYVDEVTGLPNREYLLQQLGRITDGLRITAGRAAIIRFDIDQIDLAESASGRYEQDEILKKLSMRLTRSLRAVTRTGSIDDETCTIVARIDNRQFAVLLTAIKDGSDAAAVAERLSESMQQPINTGSRDVAVLVSAGIALFPQDGADAITLFQNAGAAATDAKNSRSTRQKFHSGTACPSSNKWNRSDFRLSECFAHHFHVTRRAVDSANGVLRWSFV